MDDDTAISYAAAVPGTPVLTSTGTEIGTLEHVLEVPELDVFDGLVVSTKSGLRFVDADQVERITVRSITSRLDDDAAGRCRPRTEPRSTAWTPWRTPASRCMTCWAGCSAARTGPRRSESPAGPAGDLTGPEG